MLKTILISLFVLSSGISNAQNENHSIKIGDILIISQPLSDTYKHIDFPRKNIIIKRGAIADFHKLKGMKVIVEEVKTSKDGSILIRLTRKDGKKFFNFWPAVTANYNDALSSGEIKIAIKNKS
tara:strand:- start:231 stop:602 length:372 start_codon:yes stop_codon:yes gene_type:complete